MRFTEGGSRVGTGGGFGQANGSSGTKREGLRKSKNAVQYYPLREYIMRTVLVRRHVLFRCSCVAHAEEPAVPSSPARACCRTGDHPARVPPGAAESFASALRLSGIFAACCASSHASLLRCRPDP